MLAGVEPGSPQAAIFKCLNTPPPMWQRAAQPASQRAAVAAVSWGALECRWAGWRRLPGQELARVRASASARLQPLTTASTCQTWSWSACWCWPGQRPPPPHLAGRQGRQGQSSQAPSSGVKGCTHVAPAQYSAAPQARPPARRQARTQAHKGTHRAMQACPPGRPLRAAWAARSGACPPAASASSWSPAE